ncbi:DHA2 family efflux MFS transporter permease subunit [Dactylosporangium sp. CA-052675]|uniref:DHA2 family efflux MFS transporter permease subunit n=1 Tax=Dactylosporangium sp. CA-052675 TaxID=3239927 RepID=UPI003D8CD6A3
MSQPAVSQPAVPIDRKRWSMLAAICFALVMVVIDNTVLNIAIPTLMTELSTTAAEAQWAFTSYLLVLSGFVLVGGVASDRYGRKRIVLVGIALFGAASLAAALAAEPWQLIAARAVMGFGAALLMPGTLAILMHTFSEAERPKAIGAWMAVAAVGSSGGPVLGGFLISHFWWGAVFLINVPISILCLVALMMLVPDMPATRNDRIDWIGAVLSVIATVSIVWAITSVPEQGWASADVQLPAVIGVLALAAFIAWELRVESPMLDLGLFRNLRFSAAVLGGLLASFGMAGSLFLLTLHFQLLNGYTPIEASVRMLPLAICTLIGSTAISAIVLQRLGAPLALLSSMSVAAIGLLLIGLLPAEDYLNSLAGLILVGLGTGSAGPVAGTVLMSSVPLEKAGAGSGVSSTIQELGNGLGVAVLGTVLTAFFVTRLPGSLRAEGESSFTDAIGRASGGALDQVRDAFATGLSFSQVIGALTVLGGGLAASALLWVTRSQATPQTPSPDQPSTPAAKH